MRQRYQSPCCDDRWNPPSPFGSPNPAVGRLSELQTYSPAGRRVIPDPGSPRQGRRTSDEIRSVASPRRKSSATPRQALSADGHDERRKISITGCDRITRTLRRKSGSITPNRNGRSQRWLCRLPHADFSVLCTAGAARHLLGLRICGHQARPRGLVNACVDGPGSAPAEHVSITGASGSSCTQRPRADPRRVRDGLRPPRWCVIGWRARRHAGSSSLPTATSRTKPSSLFLPPCKKDRATEHAGRRLMAV
jgi:hypothetical protein